MLFVFLSHFGEAYFLSNGKDNLLALSRTIGMIASPTFMIISGMMLGLLYQANPGEFGPTQKKLIDRAIFFITIGHVIILIGHIPLAGGFKNALGWMFITDTIGFCILLGSLMITKLTMIERIVVSIGLFVFSWWVIYFLQPNHWLLRLLKEIFFGQHYSQKHILSDVFPLLPWFSLYLISTCIGERFGQIYSSDHVGIRKASNFILVIAIACEILVFFVKGTQHLLSYLHINSLWGINLISEKIFELLQLRHKLPPSLFYFLFYGGIGLMILFWLIRLEGNRFIQPYLNTTAMLGQTSMFVFILQYCIYFTIFPLLKIPFTIFWPLIFIVSVLFIIWIANLWHRSGLNRCLSFNFWLCLARKSKSSGNCTPHVPIP